MIFVTWWSAGDEVSVGVTHHNVDAIYMSARL